MTKFRFSFFIVLLLVSVVLSAQVSQWDKEAQKLQNSLRTLNTLISVNPFPSDVPGLQDAITNKTEHVMDDLAALDAALLSEMASLSGDERQEADTAYGSLLMQIADAGSLLVLRSFDQLTATLVSSYSTSYSIYYSLAGQYSLITKGLPIGTTVNGRGGWIPQ